MYSTKAEKCAEALWGKNWRRTFAVPARTTNTVEHLDPPLPEVPTERAPYTEEPLLHDASGPSGPAVLIPGDPCQAFRDALPQQTIDSMPATPESLLALAQRGHWSAVVTLALHMETMYSADKSRLYPKAFSQSEMSGPVRSGRGAAEVSYVHLPPFPPSPMPAPATPAGQQSAPSCSEAEMVTAMAHEQHRRTQLRRFFSLVYHRPELLLVLHPHALQPRHAVSDAKMEAAGPDSPGGSHTEELPVYLRQLLVSLPLTLARVQALCRLRQYSNAQEVVAGLGDLERCDEDDDGVDPVEAPSSPLLFPEASGSAAVDPDGLHDLHPFLPGPVRPPITTSRNIKYLHPRSGVNVAPFSLRLLAAMLPFYQKKGGGEKAEGLLVALLAAVEMDADRDLGHVLWASEALFRQFCPTYYNTVGKPATIFCFTRADRRLAREAVMERVHQRQQRILRALIFVRYTLRRVTGAFDTFQTLLRNEVDASLAAEQEEKDAAEALARCLRRCCPHAMSSSAAVHHRPPLDGSEGPPLPGLPSPSTPLSPNSSRHLLLGEWQRRCCGGRGRSRWQRDAAKFAAQCVSHTLLLQRLACLCLQVGNPFFAVEVRDALHELAQGWMAEITAAVQQTPSATTSGTSAGAAAFRLYMDMSERLLAGFTVVSEEAYREGHHIFNEIFRTTDTFLSEQATVSVGGGSVYGPLPPTDKYAPAPVSGSRGEMNDNACAALLGARVRGEEQAERLCLHALHTLRTRAQVSCVVLVPYLNIHRSAASAVTEAEALALAREMLDSLMEAMTANPAGLANSDAFLFLTARSCLFTGEMKRVQDTLMNLMELTRAERASLPAVEDW
eukprot:gene3921-2789_t